MTMNDFSLSSGTKPIKALDHLDPDGSVVRSGLLLADAILISLKSKRLVCVSLKGLRGASSSYFNVLLRRLQEECGDPEIENYVRFEFDSRLQETVFQRSRQALRKGPHQPSQVEPIGAETPSMASRPWWNRLWRS